MHIRTFECNRESAFYFLYLWSIVKFFSRPIALACAGLDPPNEVGLLPEGGAGYYPRRGGRAICPRRGSRPIALAVAVGPAQRGWAATRGGGRATTRRGGLLPEGGGRAICPRRGSRPIALAVNSESKSMSKLPKFDIPGHAHFVTTNINRSMPLFVTHDFCRILLSNVEFYRCRHDFAFLGYAINLDHFHAVICPQHDVSIRKIMQDIKRYTAKEILACLREQPTTWDDLGGLIAPLEQLRLAYRTPARRCLRNLRVPTLTDFRVTKPRTKGQEHQVWQKSFYDFNIYTEKKLREKLDYMHNNPVKWRLVDEPGDYLYSSYRNYFGNDGDDLSIKIDLL